MPLHKSESESGGMDFTARLLNRPLLPFERQVCDAIGCTEDEYRVLTAEAIRRGQVRPAAYDHIPEIVAGPLVVSAAAAAASSGALTAGALTATGALLVNLAIGLALSAISYLLTPKPKSNSTQQRKLADITGTTRFSPTSGFDSQAELADFGEPIPIIFGKWTGTSGGMLVSPKLVWSRMFSYGTQQGVKLLFVVGEQGVADGVAPDGILPPTINGIFLGNGALDSVYESSFAFYWKRNTTISGFSRVKATNLLYGTRGSLVTGDPESDDDIFSCPTATSNNDHGFSSAHSLSNNAQFGCYAPIANATGYRVNWQVISILQIDGPDDPEQNLAYQRIKISGDDNGNAKTGGGIRALGQAGVGRNYSRRMGIISLNGSGVSDSTGYEIRSVNKGDTIQFKISKVQIPVDIYNSANRKVSVDDINTYLNEERIAADDALQIGETFMIGRTTWQVSGRSIAIWRPEDNQDQIVDLKCIDVDQSAAKSIGIVSNYMLTANYIYDTTGSNNNTPGTAFYPLMRVDKATIRNTRACEVTEVGLRSQVYQRLNSICNFQSIPTPTELLNLEDKKVAITAGSINAYTRRASAFTIYLRPAGLDDSGQPFAWQPINQLFCVIGNQPVDQYNYIRIRHPQKRQYEYQFVPVNGCDIGRNLTDTTTFWHLFTGASIGNAGAASLLSTNVSTAYGTFVISTVGNVVTKLDIQRNAEFQSKASVATRVVSSEYPSGVGIRNLLPDYEDAKTTTLASTEFIEYYTEPSYAYTEGRAGSWSWEIARKADGIEPADQDSRTEGQIAEFQYKHTVSDGRWYVVKYRWQKFALPSGHFSGQQYSWIEVEQNVINSSNNWDSLSEFIVTETITSGNPFKTPPSSPTLTQIGIKRRVTGVNAKVQVGGRSQAWYEQMFGPARNYSVGTVREFVINHSESYFSAPLKIRLTLRSSVIYDPNDSRSNYKYSAPSITVSPDPNNTSSNWFTGKTFDVEYTVSAGNPFYATGQTVGATFIIEGITKAIVQSVNDAGRVFEPQSQYADVSFYGSLIEKSNNSSAEHSVVYVNEMTANNSDPQYDNMTLAGLSLKASRNFSSLDQLRVWLKDGIPVKHFHPDETGSNESSNLFCDLVYHLLTDQVAGVGKVLNMSRDYAPLINTADLAETAKFLKANKLFFDGAITNAVNIRQFISETAPYMLCNFVIADGQFSLQPAVPTDSGGNISTQPLTIKQLFTSGNILEDSFELEYLPAEERKNFTAVMRFREERENQLPQERNIAVNWKGESGNNYILESFDLTQYCTNRDHAFLVARFLLSIRRRITHTIRFQTTPFGITLAPGDFIRVVTETSPYNAVQNGSISSTGVITSASTFADGQYSVLYYRTGFEDVQQGTMNVSGQIVQNTEMRGGLFSVLNATVSQNVYMVEQLTLDSESTVQITASEFPCDSSFSSLIAQDLVNADRFEVDA